MTRTYSLDDRETGMIIRNLRKRQSYFCGLREGKVQLTALEAEESVAVDMLIDKLAQKIGGGDAQ